MVARDLEYREAVEEASSRDIRLPEEFSPERALALALKMNACAHELRY
jgi:hypothetical protein